MGRTSFLSSMRWSIADDLKSEDFQVFAGIGSATLLELRGRNASWAAISTKLGFSFFIASRPALMPRIALTSST